jgi:hypothetical protein
MNRLEGAVWAAYDALPPPSIWISPLCCNPSLAPPFGAFTLRSLTGAAVKTPRFRQRIALLPLPIFALSHLDLV